MLLVERQVGHPACKKTEWWGADVVVCLERGADLHMAQLMPLPLTVCVCVIINSRASTASENLSNVGPVDVEIIGLIEIVKIS